MSKYISLFSCLAATAVLLCGAGSSRLWAADSPCTSDFFTITSSGGGTFPASGGTTTISWHKQSGGSNDCPSFITTTAPWFTLQGTAASSSTTGSATLVIAPNTSSATRTGVIQVQSSPTDTTSLSVSQTGTTLTVDAKSLTFNAPGGVAPPSQTINVAASGGAVLIAAQPTSTGNWLSVSPSSPTTPSVLTVTANPAGLAAGTYQGNIQIFGAGLQVPVDVTLTVTSSAPSLVFAPTATTITGLSGSATLQSTAVILRNPSAGSSPGIVFTILADQDWLNVTSSGNSTLGPGQSTPITLTANSANLKPGVYTGHVVAQGGGVSATLNVTFNVTGSTVSALVNPITLTTSTGVKRTFAGVGQLTGDAANVAITVTQSNNFLSADATAKSPGAFGVTIDATNLVAGNYAGALLIQCTGTSSCLPVTVQVIVTVNPGTGSLNFLPSAATLTMVSGSATPQSASINLQNDGSSATSFTVSSDQSWLTGTPSTGSVAAGQKSAVNVTANAANLAPGMYTGHITAAGTGTAATYTVTLTVSGAIVRVSPNPLTVTLPAGTVQSFPGAVQLSGDATSVAVSVTQGNAYLTADALSQSPGTFSISVDATKLAPGTYPGALSLRCPQGCIPVVLPVSVVVTQGSTTLGFGSPSASVSINAGSAAPQTVTTTLTNNGTGPGNFSLTTDQPWLSATPSGGVLNPGQSINIVLTAMAQNLTPGTYTGHVIAGGAVFTVNLSVTGVSLYAVPNPASFTIGAGTKQTFNTVQLLGGSGPVSIAVTSGSIWLSTDAAIQAPGNLNITIDATSLKPGSYSGALAFTCQTACVSFNLPIDLTVTANGGLVFTPSNVTFNSYQGRPAPTSQTLTVKSSDGSAVGFNITNPFSWLGISSLTGTTPATLTLTPNITGLTTGAAGNLTFTTTTSQSTVVLPVNLNLQPFTISATPNPVAVRAVGGQRGQASLSIATVDGASASLQLSTTTFWMSVPSSFTAPGNLTIQADATTLGPGVYPGSVTISCASANPCQPLQIPVNLTVSNTAVLLSDVQSIAFPLTPNSQAVHLTSSDGATAINYTLDPTTLPNWLAVSSDRLTTPATLTFSVPSPPSQQGAANVKINSAYGAVTIVVTYTFSANPTINSGGVVSAGGSQARLRSGSWATIYGNSLSKSPGRDWAPTDFTGTAFPTSLDGVSVSVGGKPAFVRTISPNQINFQCPDGIGTGPVPVTVTNSVGTSNMVMATVDNYAPAFFIGIAAGSRVSRNYVAATETADGGGVVYIGPANSEGVRPAKAGENLTLWGTGFGPTTPNVAAGAVFSGAASLNDTPQILIDGVAVPAQFAGLSGAGLYQFNIVVPTLAPGDHKLTAMIGGASTADGIWLATQ